MFSHRLTDGGKSHALNIGDGWKSVGTLTLRGLSSVEMAQYLFTNGHGGPQSLCLW
jgi:hypothetical protein